MQLLLLCGNLLSHMNKKGNRFNGLFIMGILNNHGMMSAQFDCEINYEKISSVEQEHSKRRD